MSNLSNSSVLTGLLPKVLVTLVVVAMICALIALAFYRYKFTGELSTSTEHWGQFGDYLGGTLNPLLAFFALIALLLSTHVQVLELKQSSSELAKSAEALHKQQESMARQNFESMFFQMVKLHNDIVSAIDLRTTSKKNGSSRTTLGRDCFKVFFGRFSREAQKALRGDFKTMDHASSMQEAYAIFHSKNEPNVGHYFRNLYRAFKFISESEERDKRRYSGILRAQLSTYELLLLFYNSRSAVGEKFQKYVEEFELLENMPINLLIDKEDLRLYALKAFGDQGDKVRAMLASND